MSRESNSVAELTPRKKLSLLVVSLGEIDEAFKTLMAMKAIKHLYPEIQFTVIARAQAVSPFRRVSFIENVIEVPKVERESDSVAKVAGWIGHIIDQNYDILTNWTHTKKHCRMAALVSTLIPAGIKLGNYLRDDMSESSFDAWSMYREAWFRNEVIEQDIHFTDLITTQLLTVLQIHAGDPNPDSASAQVTSKYFFDIKSESMPDLIFARPKSVKWIAFHAESFGSRASEWLDMVMRRHPDYGVIVVGDGHEIDFSKTGSRVIRLSQDELHFDALVATLTACSWLVCGAHPIADLASLLNVRIFYIAPKSVSTPFSLKWTENGPYGNGHIALVSQADQIEPELAYAAWSYYQAEWIHEHSVTLKGHFDNLGVASALSRVQLFKSRIRAPAEGGGVSFEQTEGYVREFDSWMYRVRGQMARSWFCGWLPSVDQEIKKLGLSPPLVKRVREIHESLLVLQKLCLQGRALALDLANSAKQLKGSGKIMSLNEREKIEEFGKKILEVESLMGRVSSVEPGLACMKIWYQELVKNLQSETISGMAKETVHSV